MQNTPDVKPDSGRRSKSFGTRLGWAMCLVLIVASMVLTGCKSVSVSRYVSPRITGFVLDAETGQAVRGVRVSRIDTGTSRRPMDPVKGGQELDQPATVATDRFGYFELASVRSLTPFRSGRWYSVSLSFRHPAYIGISSSYPSAKATNSAVGEPRIDVGTVLLTPRER